MGISKEKLSKESKVELVPLVITRILKAPRAKVWKAWTDPKEMMKWWGPQYFTAPFCTIDFRVGGKYLVCMRDPKGNDYWSTGTYVEIVPLQKIGVMDSFSNEKGEIISAETFGMKGYPLKLLITMEFEDVKGATKMTVTSSHPKGTPKEMASSGWNTMLDKLVALLEK